MSSAARSKAVVLVVESDAVSRELLAQLLQAGDFEPIAVATGERALLTLCRHGREIDWLVTDVSLPGLIDGWLLADEYHQHHPDRPVLLIQSDADTAKMSAARTIPVPTANPMKVLETLKILRKNDTGPAVPLPVVQAA